MDPDAAYDRLVQAGLPVGRPVGTVAELDADLLGQHRAVVGGVGDDDQRAAHVAAAYEVAGAAVWSGQRAHAQLAPAGQGKLGAIGSRERADHEGVAPEGCPAVGAGGMGVHRVMRRSSP
ncbi:hypothetical protein ACFYZ8_33695 [Streptomyces sp. NPDC001668]|uniref:hypothetical protein n=1 Tax=Streptomyces sp. NPDC001668 TaxID=3364598 RepID=UPI0036A5A5C0